MLKAMLDMVSSPGSRMEADPLLYTVDRGGTDHRGGTYQYVVRVND